MDKKELKHMVDWLEFWSEHYEYYDGDDEIDELLQSLIGSLKSMLGD